MIDYGSVDTVAETVHRHPGGIDAAVNLALGGPGLIEVGRAIRPGGRLLNVAFPGPEAAEFGRADLTVQTVYGSARAGDLDELAAQAVAGKLPNAISRRYPLQEAVRAYADLVHSHVRGKFVVAVTPAD